MRTKRILLVLLAFAVSVAMFVACTETPSVEPGTNEDPSESFSEEIDESDEGEGESSEPSDGTEESDSEEESSADEDESYTDESKTEESSSAEETDDNNDDWGLGFQPL